LHVQLTALFSGRKVKGQGHSWADRNFESAALGIDTHKMLALVRKAKPQLQGRPYIVTAIFATEFLLVIMPRPLGGGIMR